ncbi:MAG: rhodanese-related sulfurtransferase [Gammaproteobacteria bacterium]
MNDYHIAAFYHFADLSEFADWQTPLEELCEQHGLIGTILLASEGVNGTVAGSQEGLEALLAHLRSDPRFAPLQAKWSKTSNKPFLRMKIRLKKEIVSLGVAGVKPHELTGHQVPAAEWNELISDPDVLVIDTRNQYEVDVGTFENAVSPHSDSFREFPKYVADHLDPEKNRKVAMFCTGGIRCEKASAYMLEQGFEEVYQLEGGILKYLEDTKETDSMWQGECFVFDRRVTVDGALNEGSFIQCHACRRPLTAADTETSDYEKGVSCPHCIAETSEERRAAFRERQRQVELSKRRGGQHIGPD